MIPRLARAVIPTPLQWHHISESRPDILGYLAFQLIEILRRRIRALTMGMSPIWMGVLIAHHPSPAEPFIQEALSQIDKEERLQKLEETFQSVKEDYHRILALVQ